MVFIFHAGLLSHYPLGAAGVSFFFVLSGFILTFNYHDKLQNIGKDKVKKFYLARFAKIYPVHFLTFIFAVPITLAYFNPNGLYLIKASFMSFINLTLIQSFIPSQGTYFNFNGVSWTLSVEMFFYLTFPFLLWTFSKMKINKNVVKSLSILFVIWVGLFSLNINLDANNKFFVWMFHIFPLARLFEFALGMVLGLIFVSKSNNLEVLNNKLFSVLEFLSILILIGAMAVSSQFDVGIVRGGFFTPVWCILVYVFAHQKGIFSKVLSNKFLVYLGGISFSFYMVHQLVIRYYDYFGYSKTYEVITSFGLTMLLSALIYQYYEEPLRKWIRFGASKKQQKVKLVREASA